MDFIGIVTSQKPFWCCDLKRNRIIKRKKEGKVKS